MRKDRHEYYRGQKGKKYGIYNTKAKCFQFGICEDTPMLAEARLFQMIGDDARKWRFEPRALPPDGKTAQHVIFDEAPSRQLLLDRAVHILNEAHPLAPEPEHILTLTVEDHAALHAGMDYTPACPRGYVDCVNDPAYIKLHDPEWYAELYGDKTPEEAAHEKNGCFDRLKEDPDEKYYCYDDEDK